MGDRRQPFGIDDLYSGGICDDLVEDRELRRPTPQGPPLGLQQRLNLRLRKVGKGDSDVGLGHPVGGGQRPQNARDGGAEVRHGVDGKEPGEKGYGVEGQGFEAPDQILKPRGSR
jgi:hypothetical protein